MAVSDWDRRELCPDGNCTGLIGPEGTCKVCGRVAPNWGDERKRGTIDDSDEDDADEADDDVPDPVKPATQVAIGGGAWAARTLCSDGGCVGVIGDDGLCKVCGKPGEGAIVANADDELADDEEWDDEEDEEGDDEGDADDDELAAAASDVLAGVASTDEVASAKQVAAAAADDEADDEDDKRALCPDGGCIGVIGPDGKCKVCGKEAAA